MGGTSIWMQMLEEPLPVETQGTCINHRKCRTPSTDSYGHPTALGNGYCQRCWDLGIPNRAYRREREMTYD